MNRWITQYCRVLAFLMVLCLATMVVLVFTNVVLRYAFSSGITISEELSRWLFVWLTFMGAIIALHEHAHLGTDTLVSRLSIRGKKFCLGLGHLLMLFICWLVFKGTLEQVKINWTSTSAVMEASLGYFYLCGLLFAVSGGIIILYDFWRLCSGQMADSELVGVRDTEDLAHAEPVTAK